MCKIRIEKDDKKMNYKLSILDQSPIISGTTSSDALQQTVELAQKAEAWGYTRFWVSEHHHTDQLAGSSPEVLISYISPNKFDSSRFRRCDASALQSV